MPEGLSPQEVGKEIAEHTKPKGDGEAQERQDRIVSIVEAILLSIVALLAAWSGYAAAKWSTESRVGLAQASAARTKANRANETIELRTSTRRPSRRGSPLRRRQSTGDEAGGAPFRPGFRKAFDAWRATNPEHNPNAPRARPSCRNTGSRGSLRGRRWTSRRTSPSPQGAAAQRPTRRSHHRLPRRAFLPADGHDVRASPYAAAATRSSPSG
jgi:hypothetical protein